MEVLCSGFGCSIGAETNLPAEVRAIPAHCEQHDCLHEKPSLRQERTLNPTNSSAQHQHGAQTLAQIGHHSENLWSSTMFPGWPQCINHCGRSQVLTSSPNGVKSSVIAPAANAQAKEMMWVATQTSRRRMLGWNGTLVIYPQQKQCLNNAGQEAYRQAKRQAPG